MDRHTAIAEVHRAGLTLRDIDRQAGLSIGSASKALRGFAFPAAERAVADCLKLPLHVVFPDRYRSAEGGQSIRLVEYRIGSTAEERPDSPIHSPV